MCMYTHICVCIHISIHTHTLVCVKMYLESFGKWDRKMRENLSLNVSSIIP